MSVSRVHWILKHKRLCDHVATELFFDNYSIIFYSWRVGIGITNPKSLGKIQIMSRSGNIATIEPFAIVLPNIQRFISFAIRLLAISLYNHVFAASSLWYLWGRVRALITVVGLVRMAPVVVRQASKNSISFLIY